MKDILDQAIFKKVIFLLSIIVLVGFLGYNLGTQRSSPNFPSDREVEELARPTAEVELNEKFEFPIEGEETSFSFTLIGGRKVKLIAMQGNPISADADEEFLVFSIELENNNPYPLEVNSQNFIRLVGEENKNYAPDFHNDQTEVPADSIKKDEVAFIVPANQKQFKLIVGPITEEERTEIEINF